MTEVMKAKIDDIVEDDDLPIEKVMEEIRHGTSVKLYTILKCELFFLHKKA